MAEPRNRYSTVSLLLHWGIAALVVTQVVLIAMSDNAEGAGARQWIGLHKSVGLTILMLTLVRIGWRIANPAIALPTTVPRWQRLFARTTHVLFYVVLIGLPLGGWASSSAGGRAIEWFGLFNWPLLPLPQSRELAGAFMDAHRLAVKALYLLIFLHVAGALKHQFIDRDNVLHRMIPLIPPSAVNADIEGAARALSEGSLVILPTETVYGLAADAGNADAVASIFAAKGRPRFNPLIAHVADLAAAEIIGVFDDTTRRLADAFWPGPLTLVVPVRSGAGVCDLARAGLDTVAIRVPGHPIAQDVLTAFAKPVVAPSANRSGRPSPTTFADALEETGGFAAVCLDGGSCAVGVESTVVSVLDSQVALLRPGSVTRDQIEALVGADRRKMHMATDPPAA